ncbi:MAG: hypothetical protein HYV02_01085 [Deltaproteobacteria bacterium]|nr:hypothetical protein [Deltaproteobacteria bacterium]
MRVEDGVGAVRQAMHGIREGVRVAVASLARWVPDPATIVLSAARIAVETTADAVVSQAGRFADTAAQWVTWLRPEKRVQLPVRFISQYKWVAGGAVPKRLPDGGTYYCRHAVWQMVREYLRVHAPEWQLEIPGNDTLRKTSSVLNLEGPTIAKGRLVVNPDNARETVARITKMVAEHHLPVAVVVHRFRPEEGGGPNPFDHLILIDGYDPATETYTFRDPGTARTEFSTGTLRRDPSTGTLIGDIPYMDNERDNGRSYEVVTDYPLSQRAIAEERPSSKTRS